MVSRRLAGDFMRCSQPAKRDRGIEGRTQAQPLLLEETKQSQEGQVHFLEDLLKPRIVSKKVEIRLNLYPYQAIIVGREASLQ